MFVLVRQSSRRGKRVRLLGDQDNAKQQGAGYTVCCTVRYSRLTRKLTEARPSLRIVSTYSMLCHKVLSARSTPYISSE